MAAFQLAKLRLLLEWGFQLIPADAAAGVDKRDLFSWKRTEGFVNTWGKKMPWNWSPFSGTLQGAFNVIFHFYPRFLCHHHPFGAGIGMLLAGVLESGGSLWNNSVVFCVCLGILFLASAADLLFFPGISVWDTGPAVSTWS